MQNADVKLSIQTDTNHREWFLPQGVHTSSIVHMNHEEPA